LFATSIIYFFGISLTLYFIQNSEIVFVTENNDITFFFNEGIIVTTIVIVFTFWIFANTTITANRQIPFESLDDLIYYLSSTVDDGASKLNWNRFNSNVFYYAFDYTIAIGHISDKQNFQKYLVFLYNLFHNYPVKFQAITYSKEKLLEKFENLYKILDENDRKIYCIEANDETIFYLNNFKEKKAGHKKSTSVFKNIFYKCFRDGELEFSNPFIKEEMEDFVYNNKLCEPNKDKDNKDPVDKINSSFIHYTNEIGLTRFIVSNLFVIQFVASNNKNGKVPAGYISEDITLIERYKNAFEEYMESEKS